MRHCPRCLTDKPLDQFAARNSTTGSLNAYCKACSAEYTRDHYAANRAKYIEKARRQDKKRRDFIRSLRERPCADCGVQYPWYVMEFDHLPEFVKSASVTRLQKRSMKVLMEEVAKCEVVCANCHCVRTYNRMVS